MSSPVLIPLSSFIKIDRRKEEAIYLQIVYQVINAVKNGLLEDGDRIPGSRKIAEELQVHRKTIIASLNELQEQGWINPVPNIGTFVSNPEIYKTNVGKRQAFQHPPEISPYTFRKEFILDTPLEDNKGRLYFTDGTPDYRLIKTEELVRFYTSVFRRKTQSQDPYLTGKGNDFFRDQLRFYLNMTRRFHLNRDFLLPVAGLEKVYSILSRLLIKKGDIVLVEELSYFLPNMIFNQAGAAMKTIPVDAEGMNIEYIRENFKPGEIRLLYLNTNCQYPTTVGLSPDRKKELLQLAEAHDFLIIEDDTDFEFSLDKAKDQSLLSKNGGNRVIYVGSFGRFLNPEFQMNFIIAPKDLLQEASKYLNIFGKPQFMMEKALGELIYQGDIYRYQRKIKKVITERKELFSKILQTQFGSSISYSIPISGLAFWMEFKENFSLSLLQVKAGRKGVVIPSICLYQNRNLTALRLGFANLNPQEMEEALNLLAETYREVMEEKYL